MFDLSWGEIIVIGVVALLVIGPKELPGVLRGMGQALAKLRRMASDFQYQFNQALQEAEVDKVKSSISSVTEGIGAASSFNPIDYARDQIKSAVDEVKGAAPPAATPEPHGPPAPAAAADPAGDPLAAGLPAPPTYTADPASLQKAFARAPIEPPPGFVAAVASQPSEAEATPQPPAPADPAPTAPADEAAPIEPGLPRQSQPVGKAEA